MFVMESSCLEMSFQPPGVSDVLASFSFSTGIQSHVALDEPSASKVSHKHVRWVFVVRCEVCELGLGVTGLHWNSRLARPWMSPKVRIALTMQSIMISMHSMGRKMTYPSL